LNQILILVKARQVKGTRASTKSVESIRDFIWENITNTPLW
jgi:hypothetical protein